MIRFRIWLTNHGYYLGDGYVFLSDAMQAAQGTGYEVRIDRYNYDTKAAESEHAYSPIYGWTDLT